MIALHSPDRIEAGRQPASPGDGYREPAEPGQILLTLPVAALRNGLSNGLIWPKDG
ncbi:MULTISPECIES: hypothetical protein [unclassified Chelatococcus]|uniref:hypothetical protein n=1 Tax=unclassified Chelatococcus TaxID=2638111 RepID=UPI001BCED4A1|nr:MULTISPECIES: hypothetical protein [unclassified Chelatococcus]MBS7701349.1 hypothetical protein [Chelatococcus sp. YT9]MBX3557429.1 hypothetical protein [Chelatococcus sp.]